jgi:tRNA nucleotidyltransferase (CCA-adding enzyme)
MAFSPKNGLTDPFGGQADLAKGVVRAVGDPMLRFSEDALRILRGIRFAATFGFEIEPMTSTALRGKAELLKNVSAERIYVELRKTFDKPHSYGVVKEYSDVLLCVMAGLDSLVLPEKASYDMADYMSRILSIFYLSSEDPVTAFDGFATALKTDSHFRRLGAQVLTAVGKYDVTDSLGLTKCLRDVGEEAALELVNLEKTLGHEADSDLLSGLLASGVCYRISDLKVGGMDLKNIGLAGPKIGLALDSLLTAVIEGRVENEREALIEFLETNQRKI